MKHNVRHNYVISCTLTQPSQLSTPCNGHYLNNWTYAILVLRAIHWCEFGHELRPCGSRGNSWYGDWWERSDGQYHSLALLTAYRLRTERERPTYLSETTEYYIVDRQFCSFRWANFRVQGSHTAEVATAVNMSCQYFYLFNLLICGSVNGPLSSSDCAPSTEKKNNK
jgi:hypothetical protein